MSEDTAPLDIPLLDLQGHHCREVTGTDDSGLALYCGQPKSGRTSYCSRHRRINLVVVAHLAGPRKKVWGMRDGSNLHPTKIFRVMRDHEKKKTEKGCNARVYEKRRTI